MNEKLKKIIKITVTLLGSAVVILSVTAKCKKKDTVYENAPEEKNPLEGKKVIFVENETDAENADGVKGHLESAGDSEYHSGFYEKYIKRIIDIVLSFGGLVILSPVFAVIAIVIKIEDPGPVIFTQKRMGKNKQYFKLHKFRSMKVSTPHNVPTHMLENPDQYITRIGKFLRRHSLDELPQIWDIFIGNMSVIGPRPALWNQDLLVAERDKYRANEVKPGLTGWAQINGRDELEIPEKARLDGEYVKKMSLLMDIRCFLRSVHVLRNDGFIVEGKTEDKEKTRIAVLSSHTPSLFWFRMDMMKAFKECGCDVFAIGNEDEKEWTEKFAENGITYRQIKVQRNGINPLNDLKTLFSIKRVLKEIMPNKIFTYQAKTVIYGGIIARQVGINEVYPLIAGIGSVFLEDDLKTKIIRRVMTIEYELALRKACVVFFQNHDDEEIFRNNHIIKRQRVVMLPGSGVNLNYFKRQPLPEKFAFLCISRLIRDKGVYEFLEASRRIKKRYPEIRFLLVGPYDSNPSAIKPEELQPFIEEGTIEYFGEQEDVRPYFAQSNVFVLPSYREGTPKTNLEAMASGRAIITTDAPGCRETVVDGENGYLIPVKDVDALCEKMTYFINNPDIVSAMGCNGRKRAEELFDVEIVNKRICETMGLSPVKY